ncbi:cyclodeaminase/cyclohydrolase family protein [Chloroflexus aggregans]|uniref:Formiminotransferase-cyclodeaminase n=1 Tax=Chloroflexus aggregans (strain MD-66 / DSM 9485) TaxID=326427 RepID=B8GC38_CHLAD|nr:cyclodeaminase/cyclohydrolase family protein [Chloroflexus aggregans]ACL23012.1 Formiminotransferase-cyclodeaminase [Chloroflexus aggregans DSM 9485]
MSESLMQQPLGAILDALASRAPTPGGGSVAALTGAMAAGLVSMVCELTIGKPQFAEVENELRAIHAQAEQLRAELQRLADEDIAVFNRLAAAYKLPRTTEADAATRKTAIQQITRLAAEVPLRTAQAAAALLPLCTTLANNCARLVVSDVGVAALLVRATVQSAALNVEINLAALEDQIFVRETRAQLQDLLIGLGDEVDGIVTIVRGRMVG